MSTTAKLSIALILLLVLLYVAYSYFFGTSTSQVADPKTAPKASTPNKWASDATLAYLASDGHKPWRMIADDEWGSMYSTFSGGLGYDITTGGYAPTLKPNANTVLAWFKGMDIDPVRHQDYAGRFKADILTYAKNVAWQNYTDVPTGAYLTA